MSLHEWQSQLGQALLLPEPPVLCQLTALQGIEGRRIALYEELLFNTVAETLQSIYPYSYRLISEHGEREAKWLALVEQYRRAFPNQSYKLMGAVSSFSEFLSEQSDLVATMPFLPEVALYEWLEMVVLNLPDTPVERNWSAAIPPLDDWEAYTPVWNPARCLQAFQFHVPEILDDLNREGSALDVTALSTKSVDIMIYRDPHTLEARFFCLNPLTAQLLSISAQANQSYVQALERLQQAMPGLQSIPTEVLWQQAQGLLEKCLHQGLLLGSVEI